VRVAPTALFDSRGVLSGCLASELHSRARGSTHRSSGSNTKRNNSSRQRRRGAEHKGVEEGKEEEDEDPEARRVRWRVHHRPRVQVNLLTLFAEWDAAAAKGTGGAAVCLHYGQNEMPRCADRPAFTELVRRLGRQEAEVRADTYDPSEPDWMSGPFFLQAFVPAKDDLLYVTEFSAGSGPRDPRTLWSRQTSYSASYLPSASQSVARSRSRDSDPQQHQQKQHHEQHHAQQHGAEGDLGEDARVEAGATTPSGLPPIGDATRHALRRIVTELVEYFFRKHQVSIYSVTTSHVVDAATGDWVLLNVSDLCWGPSELASPRLVVQRPKEVAAAASKTGASSPPKPQTPVGGGGAAERAERPRTAPPAARVIRDAGEGGGAAAQGQAQVSPKRPAFKPSAGKPHELSANDLYLVVNPFAAPPRAGKTPKGAAEPEFFSNQLPERPLHNQLVPREGRSEELLLTAKKLAEARREIGFLAQKTATLEQYARSDESALRESDAKLRAWAAAERHLEKTRAQRDEALRTKIDDLEALVAAQRRELSDLTTRLAAAHDARAQAAQSQATAVKELERLRSTHEHLLKTISYNDCKEAHEIKAELEQQRALVALTEAEREAARRDQRISDEERRRVAIELERLNRFLGLVRAFLADTNTPGVGQEKKAGPEALPVPGTNNVRLVVKALVDGEFPQAAVDRLPAASVAAVAQARTLLRASTARIGPPSPGSPASSLSVATPPDRKPSYLF
jgi:hypothetical protein